MVFSSLVFLYFFLAFTLGAYCLCRRVQTGNIILFIASIIFYAWGEPVWILQMLLSGFMIWGSVLLQARAEAQGRSPKPYLILGIVAALLPLFIFKYFAFVVQNINMLLALDLPVPHLRMPIGISFYTFQVISYAVDYYRGNVGLQRSLWKFWLYEAFFPQLIAGPIVRYSDIEQELESRTFSSREMSFGIRRFVAGLAKKALIANNAGLIVKQTLDIGPGALSGLECLIGLVAYTFQIYFDFSAYSDMAIGLGQCFGFHFPENFNYPYVSRSVTEFWRRWHISLSSFFRDYLYIPLGGNRHHLYRNLFIVWFLTGLWHGASWNFIFWGLFFLLFLLIEKAGLMKILERSKVLGHIYMLPIILFSWALFKFTSLAELGTFFKHLFVIGQGTEWSNVAAHALLLQHLPFLTICLFLSLPIWPMLKKRLVIFNSKAIEANPYYAASYSAVMALTLFFCTAALAGDSFNPFLYFRF